MNTSPVVSIIIPTYNRSVLIRDTIESIIGQTYKNWECIIIDDGSDIEQIESLLEYIKKDKRFSLHPRPSNMVAGGNASRNYGFTLASGDFIQWFDDDDVMLENMIQSRVEYFDNHLKIVISLGYITDKDLNVLETMDFDKDITLFSGVATWRNQITTNCVMFRKSFLETVNLFNTNIFRGQETEFFSRIFFKVTSEDYRFIESVNFYYRQHANTITSKNDIYNSKFKSSEIYVAIENIKRGILLNDQSLIRYLYRVVINFLFRAIENKDETNIDYILDNFISVLRPLDSKLSKKLKVSIKTFRYFGRGIYKIEMYFKNYQLFK